jgi:cytochrome P450
LLHVSGDVDKFCGTKLSLSSASSLQAIHGAKANVKKGDWYKTLDISAGAPSTQMVIDRHEHAIRRRKMAPAFSERALKEGERIIAISAQTLAEQVGSLAEGAKEGEWTSPRNMSDWATFFGFDFISDLGYGKSFDMLQREENRWIPPVLRNASRFLYYVGYLPFIALIRPLMGTSIQDYVGGQPAADSLKYTNVANSRLAERMRLEKQMKAAGEIATRKDTFHYLLNSKDPVTGEGLTVEELQADSALVIAAGADGVGLTLSATMFYLISNPNAFFKLTSEIRSAFENLSDIQNPKLGSLRYLTACLNETLRLCPPKASTAPREVLSGGIEIDGQHIPKGVTVGTPVYVLHHDETIYPQPWSYCPERWIVDEKAGVTFENVASARAALCPFLLGPMNCIGKNMAYFALKVSLAQLLFRYDIRKAGKAAVGGGASDLEEGRHREDEYQMTDYIVGFRNGPLIELRAKV